MRNVLIRHEYHPPVAAHVAPATDLADDLAGGPADGGAAGAALLQARLRPTRNYEETARRLGLDRRTVKSKVTGGGRNPKRGAGVNR